jgi:apolipoprotein D and lipocalin family protein
MQAGLLAETMAAKIKLQSFMGMWYEVARIDNFFQKGCHSCTANYTSIDERSFTLVNTCVDGATGRIKMASGKAVSTGEDGKFAVSFKPSPITAPYWVLAVGPLSVRAQYSWAVVGDPSRSFLWVLSRSKNDSGLHEALLAAERAGYVTRSVCYDSKLLQK